MKVSLVRVTKNPVEAMSSAGSNCYDSKAHKGIVEHCYKSGHHSIMEFADFHFHIEGVSRALSHQLVRHRIASYAQRSQRYVDEDGFEFVRPITIKKNQKFPVHLPVPLRDNKGNLVRYYPTVIELTFDDMMEIVKNFYKALQKAKIPNEDARFVLTNATATVIDVKMNFRALMNFMNERLCSRAQWEIRLLAKKMKELIINEYPELEKFLMPKCEKYKPFCFCVEDNGCGKYPHISKAIKFNMN